MTESILGIDIAQLKFNVCLINSSSKLKHRVFPNTLTGFEQLLEWLSKQGIERVPRLPRSHWHVRRISLALSA